MSAETASTENPRTGTEDPERAPQALRILAIAAVCVGLAALAGGTFVLSYSGIHALALHAGVTPRLARGYPLLIDAMLVIVLAAVLALRGADMPSKLLAWTTLLAVLAAAAGADALHAAGRKLPDHVAAITAAVVPWVLVFLAFALLLAMLRHARLRRLAAARATAGVIAQGLDSPVRQPQRAPALPLDAEPDAGHSYPVVRPVLTVTHRAEPSPAAEADVAGGGRELEQAELAADAEPAPDDPSGEEIPAELAGRTEKEQAGRADRADQTDQTDQTDWADQAERTQDHDDSDDPDMPVFHRMWSPPAPPESPASTG
jgi:hypothetical protein